MTNGNLSLLLVYEPASAQGRPVPVARVCDERILRDAARAAVDHARKRALELGSRDDVLGAVEEEEVKRLEHVLYSRA